MYLTCIGTMVKFVGNKLLLNLVSALWETKRRRELKNKKKTGRGAERQRTGM